MIPGGADALTRCFLSRKSVGRTLKCTWNSCSESHERPSGGSGSCLKSFSELLNKFHSRRRMRLSFYHHFCWVRIMLKAWLGTQISLPVRIRDPFYLKEHNWKKLGHGNESALPCCLLLSNPNQRVQMMNLTLTSHHWHISGLRLILEVDTRGRRCPDNMPF